MRRDNETIRHVLDEICKEKSLDFAKMEVVIPGTSTAPSVDITMADLFDKFGVAGINFVPGTQNSFSSHVQLQQMIASLLPLKATFLISFRLSTYRPLYFLSISPTSTLDSILRGVASERSLVFEHHDILLKNGAPVTDVSITLETFVKQYNTREVAFYQNGTASLL